jgi:hypothetical protein
MSVAERELQRITEEYRRLREDLLPVFKMAKEGQPLPYMPPGTNGQTPYNQSSHNYDNALSTPAATPSSLQSQPASGGLSRKFSTKKLLLGSTPKNASPTHLPQNAQERVMMEQALDPAAAAERAVLSSTRLASLNGQGHASPGHSPNIPSPTSPPHANTLSGSTLASRSYRSDLTTPSARSTFAQSENDSNTYGNTRDSIRPLPTARRAPTPAQGEQPSSGGSASVEIFKSFRVGMEEPCYKVLPEALKKYNINAPWEHYALYIVYGDQERCLGLNEKPLMLFKQLDKEGKKPMFMLRKTTPHQDAAVGELPNSAGLETGQLRGPRTQGVAYQPPGGII